MTTQKQKILEIAREAGKKGFTYYDLRNVSNWPHTRLIELEKDGYVFTSKKEKGNTKRFRLVAEPKLKAA